MEGRARLLRRFVVKAGGAWLFPFTIFRFLTGGDVSFYLEQQSQSTVVGQLLCLVGGRDRDVSPLVRRSGTLGRQPGPVIALLGGCSGTSLDDG